MREELKKKLNIMSVATVVAFLFLMICVIFDIATAYDIALGTIFARSEGMTVVMKACTLLGEAFFLILAGVLITIFSKNKEDGAMLLAGLGIAAGLNSLLKKIIRRPRPTLTHLVEATGFSFPSGHSTSSVMFYGFIIYIVYKRCKNETVKKILIALLSIMILCVGVSRVYLGVHYVSDVLAGFSFGALCLSLYIRGINVLEERIKSKR